MSPKIPFKYLFYVFTLYVTAASLWWGYLLYKKNDELYDTKIQLMETKYAKSIEGTDDLTYLMDKKRRQERMIMGEGAVFFVFMIVGIFFVFRTLQRDVLMARQQRNFILSITHELKSPLAAIRLGVETVLKRETLTREQVRRLSGNAVQDVERLTTLVDNILVAARVESSSYQISRTPVNIGDFLDDLVQGLQMRFPEAKLGFVEQEGSLEMIQADRPAITSILLNLIENAVKYALDVPRAEVTVGLESSLNDKYVMISVADNGIGIDNKDKSKIFEKFYRIGNEDTRRTKGTGLGLYIVNELVKLHHGRIIVLDNQPKGTKFVVEMPID